MGFHSRFRPKSSVALPVPSHRRQAGHATAQALLKSTISKNSRHTGHCDTHTHTPTQLTGRDSISLASPRCEKHHLPKRLWATGVFAVSPSCFRLISDWERTNERFTPSPTRDHRAPHETRGTRNTHGILTATRTTVYAHRRHARYRGSCGDHAEHIVNKWSLDNQSTTMHLFLELPKRVALDEDVVRMLRRPFGAARPSDDYSRPTTPHVPPLAVPAAVSVLSRTRPSPDNSVSC